MQPHGSWLALVCTGVITASGYVVIRIRDIDFDGTFGAKLFVYTDATWRCWVNSDSCGSAWLQGEKVVFVSGKTDAGRAEAQGRR